METTIKINLDVIDSNNKELNLKDLIRVNTLIFDCHRDGNNYYYIHQGMYMLSYHIIGGLCLEEIGLYKQDCLDDSLNERIDSKFILCNGINQILPHKLEIENIYDKKIELRINNSFIEYFEIKKVKVSCDELAKVDICSINNKLLLVKKLKEE